MVKLIFFAFIILYLTPGAKILVASSHEIKWGLEIKDIHGKTITQRTFLDKVTVVTLSTHKTKNEAMKLGQEIGKKFGHRTGYQSLAIANTSQLSFFVRWLFSGAIAEGVAKAEEEAVQKAIKRQKTRGNKDVTEEKVRRRIIFLHDKDGKVWEHLGIDPKINNYYVGVIDKFATLVHITMAPTDKRDLFSILEKELPE